MATANFGMERRCLPHLRLWLSPPPVAVPAPTVYRPPMQPQPVEGGNLDILSVVINTLNSNPYFIGMLMLLLNLGGRFLSTELTPKQEEFLQQRWLRPLSLFHCDICSDSQPSRCILDDSCALFIPVDFGK